MTHWGYEVTWHCSVITWLYHMFVLDNKISGQYWKYMLPYSYLQYKYSWSYFTISLLTLLIFMMLFYYIHIYQYSYNWWWQYEYSWYYFKSFCLKSIDEYSVQIITINSFTHEIYIIIIYTKIIVWTQIISYTTMKMSVTIVTHYINKS